MPALNWNEIKRRAIGFANNWRAFRISSFAAQGRARERAEAQTFWNELFAVFGIDRRVVASFEEPVKNLRGDTNFIDLFYKSKLIAEHKSPGKPLDKAHAQAMDYIQSLHREGRGDEAPPFVVVSDFGRIALYDLETTKEKDKQLVFDLKDLPKHVRRFGFLIDASAEVLEDEDDADLKATRIMARLHDALELGGFRGTDLERTLVRILFCLFADDSEIFDTDPNVRPFERFVKHTRVDGSDLGPKLDKLFRELNRPREERQANLDEEIAAFPYVNGGLFEGRLDVPDFNSDMRKQLLACCAFNWSKISPAVFGSLFQGVMDDRERRQLGAHYTSERDILKLVRSLFLDDLRGELGTIQGFTRKTERDNRLREFQNKVRTLRFLDPACGCGNFLVIAYRELRRLELDVLKTLFAGEETATLFLPTVVRVNVDQFYGIEIEEWPARIAEVAMWLMDHQMNQEAAEAFALPLVRLPLTASATIRHGNALRTNWNDVLSADRCAYVLGNPPFVGAKLQSPAQRAEIADVIGSIDNFGLLDFVAAWYVKAADYMQSDPIRCAFVSTNSVTQGEQVGVLWPALLARGIKINFAHRTFRWMSDARGKAHVHVVIVGFGKQPTSPRYIFDYVDLDGDPTRSEARNINPYLVDASNSVISNRSRPLCAVPEMGIGNKPIDDGNYLFSKAERDAFVEQEPAAAKWIMPFYGAEDFLHDTPRFCLWLKDCPPSDLRTMPSVMERVRAVKAFRAKSKSGPTIKLAETPTRFHVEFVPIGNYLLIPRHTSERRAFIPMGYLDAKSLAGDSTLVVPNATLYHFGVLTSTMHMAWVRTVCGRLKSDYRYSNKLVYNNYPWPTEAGEEAKAKVERAAQGVLDARASFAGQTLADLYDPDAMPPALTKAHAALDAAVDRCYRRDPFKADRDRVEYLFALYETLAAPLTPGVKAQRTRKIR